MRVLAEDLMLLLLDPRTGRPTADSTRIPYALAGAVLLELSIIGAVRISGPGESVKPGRVVVAAG